MKILIKTGFEKVQHDIKFNPATEPKGKHLVESNHVRDVCEFRENGISYLIEAKVVRQTAVGETAYTTKLHLNDVRHIVHVTCTCCYNKSDKCKHIAASIHFINNKESRSKTNIEQQWGGITPLQFAKEKYSKGKNFYETFIQSDKSKKKIESKQKIHEVTDKGLQSSSAFKMMFTTMNERLKNNCDQEKERIETRLQIAQSENAKLINCLEKLFVLFETQEAQHYPLSLSPDQLQFYRKTIILTKQQIMQLCCDTVSQSDNSEWFKARRLRVSASKNAHNIKSRKTKSIDKLIGEMLHPLKIDNTATRYGKKMESVARKQYENLTGAHVQQLGVLVCKSKPWLCASLDGVVMQETQPMKVIEIKCPVSCEKLPIFDSESKKLNVNYLQLDNSIIVLKPSSVIYTQCQMQMYVSGLSQCDLYVYSPIKSCVISVSRNDTFVTDLLLKCAQFYFDHYLVALQACDENATSVASGKRIFTGKDISNTLK